MDRNKSRSTPYLPRYQSLSPARSTLLETRRFTSLRSVSQPSQRIYYIENSPTRVINSYHVHHSPSPHRTYKIHLCSSKTNHYLTRITRSQSTHDINSSHVYSVHKSLVGNSLKESAARRAESCEDIFHKAPFFPDITPSESGVSFGESEEGSTFGGEEDNVSQHSFDSSSAFYEVTVDSELDKGDSDNYSGPDYAGDRTLGILNKKDLRENCDIRKRSSHPFPREPHSIDSVNPLSYGGSRKRELASGSLWDQEKFTSRSEALRVVIPDSETPTRTFRNSRKEDDRREISTKPLAHSTPHVSPGGVGDLKLFATTSWNADNPFEDVTYSQEMDKSETTRALLDVERDVGHLSRLEDSSCNSSCSEGNYSDVSNTTVSSSVPRKTKLVKKPSDKPASARAPLRSSSRNLSKHIESGKSSEAARRGIYSGLQNVDREDSRGLASGRSNSEYYPDLKSFELNRNGVNDDEQGTRGKGRDGWWTAYNSNTPKGQEANLETKKYDERETFSGFRRDIQAGKSLTVNIPLITAGKYGQEKLRRLSQTSPPPTRSPNKSPTISSTGTALTWSKDKNRNQIADHSSQVNTDHFKEPKGLQVCDLKEFDSSEFHKHYENEEKEKEEVGRNQFISDHLTNTRFMDSSDNSQYGQNVWEIPLIAKTSQDEKCFPFDSQPLDLMHPNLGQEEIRSLHNDSTGALATLTQVDGTEISSSGNKEDTTCDSISFPSNYSEVSRETTEATDNSKDINRTYENVLPVHAHVALKTTRQHVTTSAKEQSLEDYSVEGVFAVLETPRQHVTRSTKEQNLEHYSVEGVFAVLETPIQNVTNLAKEQNLENYSGEGVFAVLETPRQHVTRSTKEQNLEHYSVEGVFAVLETTKQQVTSSAKDQNLEGHNAKVVIDPKTNDHLKQSKALTCGDELDTVYDMLQGADQMIDKLTRNAKLPETATHVLQSLAECGKSHGLYTEIVKEKGEDMGEQEFLRKIENDNDLLSNDTSSFPLLKPSNVDLCTYQVLASQLDVVASPIQLVDNESSSFLLTSSNADLHISEVADSQLEVVASPMQLVGYDSVDEYSKCSNEMLASPKHLVVTGSMDECSKSSNEMLASPIRLVDTYSVEERSKSSNELLMEKSIDNDNENSGIQFDSGLYSGNSMSLQDSEFSLSMEQQNTVSVGDLDSFHITENAFSLIVTSTASTDNIDPLPGNYVNINDEQQKQELLSSSIGNLQVVVGGITGEIVSEFPKQPFICAKGNQNPIEVRETPQVGEDFTSAQGNIDNTENSIISFHNHAHVTHQCTSSLQSSSDPYKSSHNFATRILTTKLTNIITPGDINQQLYDSSDGGNYLKNISDKTDSKQEIIDSDICTNITGPVVDESIKRPSDVAQRVDSLTNNEEQFCTEGSLAFVERGEEFICSPSSQKKLLIVTEISSTRVEHIQRTIIDKVVTIRGKVSNSIVGLDSANGGVCLDIFTEKSVTEAIIKENKGHTITAFNTLVPDSDKQDAVSTEGSSLNGDTVNRCSSLSSEATPGNQPAFTVQIRRSVPILHLTAQAPTVDIKKVLIENWNPNATTDLAEHFNPTVSQVSTEKLKVIAVQPTEKSESAMRSSNSLDNLQAQLSLISSETPKTHFTLKGGDKYQDHAEATSVLKQVVHDDTYDFTLFSNTPRKDFNGGRFQDYCTVQEGDLVTFTGNVCDSSIVDNKMRLGVERESYDNEYDYVTTDLIKVTKAYPRSHHHHHLVKSSSLWTLPEEAEGANDTLSPKQTRKLYVETRTTFPNGDNSSHMSKEFYKPHNDAEYKSDNLRNGERVVTSGLKDSDVYYSTNSSAERDRSPSYGPVQTSLGGTELATNAHNTNIIRNHDLINDPRKLKSYHLEFSQKNVSEMGSRGSTSELSSNYKISLKNNEDSESPAITKKGALNAGSVALLDKLSASLEQFTSSESENEERKSLSAKGDGLSLSHSRDSINNTMSLSTTQCCGDDDDDDKFSSRSSSMQTLDHDFSRDSFTSPTPLDSLEGSRYTSTGSAEIKKKRSNYFNIPAASSKFNLKPDVKLETITKTDEKAQSEKFLRFEKILDDFNKSSKPVGPISDFVFLHEKRPGSVSSASSTEDLYKSFTNDETEKTQNHVCVVVEDENMNTFRFKRFLKKSHTKRKKGRKLLKFLSKLGCVSEAVVSPTGSPKKRFKLAEDGASTFSTDSMVSTKPRISNPILISSTSFHHQDIFKTSPLKNFAEDSTHSASDNSLNSTHSVADSAYSSISESAVWTPNSPASQRVLSRSFLIPAASTGSVSSIFCPGSTSAGDWSLSDNVFSSTSESISEDGHAPSLPTDTASSDKEVMSALSDVFDQLNICVEEVDSALLNRLRYGHAEANIPKK